jgi:hypothetical protein
VPRSTSFSRTRRFGIAVVALATSIAVAAPAASAAPASFAAKGGRVAERAVGNGHAAKAQRKRATRAHKAPAKKQSPVSATKAPTPTTSTGGNGGNGTSGGNASGNPSSSTTTGKPTKAGTKATTPTGTTTTPPPTTTPPTTTPPTTSSNSELLFSGSRIRDFALTQAAPGAITEVPDPLGSGEGVMKFTVQDQDVAPITPTENPRAQLVSPDLIRSGQEFWLQAKFMIPADMPTIPGWMSLVSVYGAPYAGSSPWCIGIVGNNLAPLQRGQWTTILLHERFASDGFVEMWVNGQPITFFAPGTSYSQTSRTATSHLGMKTMDSSNGGGLNSVRISQYREAGMFQTATVYWAGVKLGTSRAAVGG